MPDISVIEARVQDMRARFVERDRAMELIYKVRSGEIHHLFPDVFSEDLPHSVVANHVDVVARDLAEVMAPLPTLDCSAGNGITAADKKRAEKKNRIGQRYWSDSRLQRAMFGFADCFNSYGVAVLAVEPDFTVNGPVIRAEDPRGLYYRRDRHGELTEIAKVWKAYAGDLVAQWPEYEHAIRYTNTAGRRGDNDMLDMVRYADKKSKRTVVYIPQCGITLASAPIITECLPYVLVERFGITDVARGQFDDVMWVQLARSIMAQYTLNAADKSINSPIVMPRDVTDFATGADAVISTDSPQGVRRVSLDVPRDVFQMSGLLDQEMKDGSRYPAARMGEQQGSIVTGRGIEALLGTFDTQLQSAQSLFKIALEDATSLCFEIDSKVFGNKRKTISGVTSGRPYQLTYVPSRDIGDSYACEVTYGFAAGMSPAQAMVALLQLRGDQLIGRDTARSQMPFAIDPEKEQRDVDQQQLTDAMMQGLMATVQAIGPMIQQGMPVDGILRQVAQVIEDRQKGRALHEAVQEAFKPPEPEPQESAPDVPGMPPPGPGGEQAELPPGIRPNGLPQGVAYGQQGSAPGGMPAIQGLIASLRGTGEPRMQADTLRKRPIGVG